MLSRSLVARIHPLALVGLFVSKKAIVYSLAKMYGLPRVYRRLAHANRAVNAFGSARYDATRTIVQRLFRLPDEIDRFAASEGVHSS